MLDLVEEEQVTSPAKEDSPEQEARVHAKKGWGREPLALAATVLVCVLAAITAYAMITGNTDIIHDVLAFLGRVFETLTKR